MSTYVINQVHTLSFFRPFFLRLIGCLIGVFIVLYPVGGRANGKEQKETPKKHFILLNSRTFVTGSAVLFALGYLLYPKKSSPDPEENTIDMNVKQQDKYYPIIEPHSLSQKETQHSFSLPVTHQKTPSQENHHLVIQSSHKENRYDPDLDRNELYIDLMSSQNNSSNEGTQHNTEDRKEISPLPVIPEKTPETSNERLQTGRRDSHPIIDTSDHDMDIEPNTPTEDPKDEKLRFSRKPSRKQSISLSYALSEQGGDSDFYD